MLRKTLRFERVAVAALAAALVLGLEPIRSAWAQQGASAASFGVETTVSHGISAFGGLKYPADFTHVDYVNPDAPKGGTISMRPTAALRTFDNFNLYIVKGDPAFGSALLHDSLVARAFDEPDAVYGLLAESIETPADRSFVVFRLREEARFSTGDPVRAEDVVWSIETLKTEASPRVALQLRDVETVTALDPLTVRVDFRAGAPTRDLPATVGLLPVFQKADYEGLEFREPRDEPPVGSGPYRLGDFEFGRTVSWELREDYWAKDLPIRRGKYNFGEITFEYFLDTEAAFQAFRAGTYDLNEEFLSRNWATRYDFEEITEGRVVKETLPDGRPSGTQAFFWNLRRDNFQDRRVREALGLAFDFEWTNERLFFGLYQRTDSYFENATFQAEGLPTDGELALLEPWRATLEEQGIADFVFGEAIIPPVTDGTGRARRSLARAGALLDEAGWTIGADQVRRNAAGEALTVEFLDRTGSSFDRIVDPYIANLERLGVAARLNQVDPAQYERRTENFDFDVVTARLPIAATPGPELAGHLSSTAADSSDSLNLSGVKSPVIDALLADVEAAGTREEFEAAARALDRVYRAGLYWTPQWGKPSHFIAYWNRFGRPDEMGREKPPYDRGIILTWWYDAERSAALDAARDG